MKFSEEQRTAISARAKGKIIESLEYDEEGGYWVMTFTDGSEVSIQLMAEL